MRYQVDFLLSLKLQKISCNFSLWPQKPLGQSVCRILYFWFVWLVNFSTGGPLIHCTCLSRNHFLEKFIWVTSRELHISMEHGLYFCRGNLIFGWDWHPMVGICFQGRVFQEHCVGWGHPHLLLQGPTRRNPGQGLMKETHYRKESVILYVMLTLLGAFNLVNVMLLPLVGETWVSS